VLGFLLVIVGSVLVNGGRPAADPGSEPVPSIGPEPEPELVRRDR
jgi:hypothetical protein